MKPFLLRRLHKGMALCVAISARCFQVGRMVCASLAEGQDVVDVTLEEFDGSAAILAAAAISLVDVLP